MQNENRWSELFLLAREGDEESIAEFCDRYRGFLFGLASLQIGPQLQRKFSASDLVQDSLIDAVGSFSTFRGATESEFKSWLRSVLANNLKDVVRRFYDAQCRDARREVSIDDWDPIQNPAASECPRQQAFQRHELDQELVLAISELPPVQQSVLKLRHQMQLPFRQIADRLGVTEVAARKTWSRAVAHLRSRLSIVELQ